MMSNKLPRSRLNVLEPVRTERRYSNPHTCLSFFVKGTGAPSERVTV